MSLLPEGYKRLLYIESTGTQYINTGVIPKSGTKANVAFRAAATPTATWWILSAVTSGTVLWRAGVNSSAFRTDGGFTYSGAQTPLDYAVATGTCTVNMSIPLYLCAQNEGGPVGFGKFKVYSCRISNGDIPVRNFIPCINGAGEVGMYDTVNGVFCGNSGTGVFIAGPEFWYDELEYIESTGAQWIGTGFLPNGNTRLLLELEVTTGGTSFLFGSRHNSSANSTSNSFSMPQINGTSLRTDYGSSEAAISVSPLQRLTIDKDKNNTTVNGITVTSLAQTFQSSYELVLFAVNTANTKSAYTSARLRFCQIYDNGTLVRDYVPAKLPDGTIGLIDKLTEEFYPNMGTGVFSAGKLKPTKYMELEYIESTGTQFVDTGFVANQDTRLDAVAMRTSNTTTSFVPYGAGSNYNSNAFECYDNGTNYEFNYDGQYLFGGSSVAGEKVSISHDKNIVKINDEQVLAFNYQAFTTPYTLFLFGIHRANPYYGSLRIYSCQIYNNGTLVRDYIPVKLYGGSVGLLDKTSGLFYGNAGTGTFVAGPELYGLDECTVLLLHGEDIVDNSDYRNAITNNGVTVSAGQSKFGGKALRFDGSSWLSLAGSIAEFGLGDFTIDFWIYPEALSKDHFYFSGDVTGAFFFGKVGSESAKRIGVGRANLAWDGYFGAGTTDNVWNHVALVRKGGTYSLYINGVLNATTANSFAVTMAGGPLLIGSQGATYNYSIKGYMDEFRLSNVARWSGNFAVQTKPYSAIVKMPPVPADLNYSVSDGTITLAWAGHESAVGYNVYRNSELVATVTDTKYSEEIQPAIGYTYAVTAFNDFGETEPASIEVAPSAAPSAPANLRVMFADFASAQIAWDASVGATVYRVYRDGEFLTETESRIFADSDLSKDTEYVYTVTAVNVVGESSASILTVKTSDFTLITDRTAADVEYALAQALNPDRNNTEWLKGLKGTYNATDLNRVEKAVEYVANRLEIAGWRRKPAVKIDWSFSDFPTVSEMQRYLDNIRLLRAALPEGMPAVPADMNGFTYIEANTIEQILLLLDAAVTNIMLNIYYSNEKYSGEVK